MPDCKEIPIKKLITCLPEPETYRDDLRRKLIGQHKILRQIGDRALQEYLITIGEVDVVPEGVGAIAYADTHNLLLNESGYAAFFDLGRGTAIYFLVDLETREIVPSSRGVIPRGGLHKLLSLIAKDPQVKAAIGKKGNISHDLILKSILNGTFIYGSTGYDLRPAYEFYAEGWLRDGKGEALSYWDVLGFSDDIQQMIFVGGAAPVASVWVDNPEKNKAGRLAIASHPRYPNGAQLANCMGLVIANPAPHGGLVYAIDPGNGWIKVANSEGNVSMIESYSANRRSRPVVGEMDDSTVYVEYVSGQCDKFSIMLGTRAKQQLNQSSTVNHEKGLIAHQLILAAIAPAEKVASIKRGVA